jgi:hypothetical protein
MPYEKLEIALKPADFFDKVIEDSHVIRYLA